MATPAYAHKENLSALKQKNKPVAANWSELLIMLYHYGQELEEISKDPQKRWDFYLANQPKGKILAGEVKKVNGKYVGAVAYSSGVHDNLPMQIMPSPDPNENPRKVSKRKAYSLTLAERASAMLQEPDDFLHLPHSEEDRSYA